MTACFFVGFSTGKSEGISQGAITCKRQLQHRTIDELKSDLAEKERDIILEYIDVQTDIKSKDEGGFWRTNYVQYLRGGIRNAAAISKVKDVRIRVDFFSKTESKIGSQIFTIYEYIAPGQLIKIKEKINPLEGAVHFEIEVEGVDVEK